MGYKVSFDEVNQIFADLSKEYEIWAPKRFPGKGRYSDTDKGSSVSDYRAFILLY
mgnify:CR=1 FL=1